MPLETVKTEVAEALGMAAFLKSAIACMGAVATDADPAEANPAMLLLDDIQTLGLTEILTGIEIKLSDAFEQLSAIDSVKPQNRPGKVLSLAKGEGPGLESKGKS